MLMDIIEPWVVKMVGEAVGHQSQQVVGLLLLLHGICSDVKSNILSVCTICVQFDVIVAVHACEEERAIIVDVPIGALWPPISPLINKVFTAQWSGCSAFAS